MRIWAEVKEPDGTTLGIVNLISLTLQRKLDAAGSIQLAVPSSDIHAQKYLRLGRYVDLYVKRDDRHERELVSTGILLKDTINVSSGGAAVTQWKATDGLEDFRRDNTLRGLVFNNRPIVDVINNLLPTGWNATFDDVSGNTSQRFDGLSKFKAIDRVRELHGLHFRLGNGANRLNFGAFGDDSGVRISNIAVSDTALHANQELIAIQRLSVVEDGHDIINWIEPISGPADAPLTLKQSTRLSPYPIQTTTGPNGKTIYYLTNNASITLYGTIKSVLAPKSLIVPVEATATALLNASNVLYDWAAARLDRIAIPQTTYQITGVKLDTPLRPGDKVHLRYRGEATQRGRLIKYVDVDADLWVLSMTEDYGTTGQLVTLEVSTVDIQPASAVDMIVETVQGQQQSTTALAINVDRAETTATADVSVATPVDVTFEVRDSTIFVPSCLITITRTSVDGPGTVSLTLDGTTIPGGPFLYGPGQLTASIDIEEILNDLDPLQGEHTLNVSVLFDGDGSDLSVKVSLVEATLGAASVG